VCLVPEAVTFGQVMGSKGLAKALECDSMESRMAATAESAIGMPNIGKEHYWLW